MFDATKRLALLLTATVFAGCAADEEATCTDVMVDGTTYCVYRGAITETGYICPDAQPRLYRDDATDLVVCSSGDERPPFEDVADVLDPPPDGDPDINVRPDENNEPDANIDPDGPPPDLQHASCAEPVSSTASYPTPDINTEDDGQPSFLNYKSLDCDALPQLVCSTDADCPGGDFSDCIKPPGAPQGVCSSFDIDIWCDGEGEVMGYGDGSCWTCIQPESHAAACCAGLDGFDCRDWPFTAGGPGSVCATSDNCEAGLICGEHRGSGYGICRCPEGEPDDVAPADSCF